MNKVEVGRILKMYEHYNYKCFVCGGIATQRAHIIGNTKTNLSRYGLNVINSDMNWLPACNLYCNALIDISNNPVKRDLIAMLIEENPGNSDIKELIEEEVKLSIKRKEGKNGKRV